ncbi:MAG: Tol-Pal system beta propeller repeat protein TolB [Gammaproteobacteria bacterium]|nr:Tol-Pal system beta propeller repeat protein TolB [Gammaproteobacteria bacterium]
MAKYTWQKHIGHGLAWWLMIVLSIFRLESAGAQGVTIEVTGGAYSGIPISVVPFSINGLPDPNLQPADIIESNLRASGRFDVIPEEQHLSRPDALNEVNYRDWRLIKSEVLVIGNIVNLGNDRYEVRFRLLDVFSETQLVGKKFVVPTNNMRQAAHQISDAIYEQMIGRPGDFNKAIAFVNVRSTAEGKTYRLQIADSDGWNPKTILESPYAILSPSWSPDASRIAYVSLEDNKTRIFIQNVWTGERTAVNEFEGLNTAPSWSPDGRKLALTLSRDGNPEIYVYDIATKLAKRITRHTAIDTEATWSPDGDTLIFTSGRAGRPHIYSVPAHGGQPTRLTRDGSYNAGPTFSLDGQHIAMITNQGNGYKIGLYSVGDGSGTVTELSTAGEEEFVRFSPSGDMLVFATTVGNQSRLSTISVNGQVQRFLKYEDGAYREPTWSPISFNQ